MFLVILETVTGFFLIWNTLLPFQNFELLSHLWIGAAVLWLTALLLQRTKHLFSSSIFFHLSLVVAYYIRASTAVGALHEWFLFKALVDCGGVLWVTAKYPKKPSAPSIFLIISFVGPLMASILHVFDATYPGFALLALAVLRVAWLHRNSIFMPRSLLVFLLLCLVAIPFSLYPWRSFQFLILNCICVLVFSISRYHDHRESFLLGYANLCLMVIAYAFSRELSSLWYVGSSILKLRLVAYLYHNDLAPIFVIYSCLILRFARDFQQIWIRTFLALILLCLGLLEALTWSRNGALAYALFAFIAGAAVLPPKKLALRVSVLVLAIILILSFSLALRTQLQERAGDFYSISQRLYNWETGVKTVAAHPVFGVGWLNFYSHAKLPKLEKPLDGLTISDVLCIQDHSVLLDMSEAGGILLGFTFFYILFKHLNFRSAPILSAGLAGIILNSLLDSAPFWPVVYVHIWILLGILASLKHETPSVSGHFVLSIGIGLLFLFACVFPISEDRLLRESQFYLNDGDAAAAIQCSKLASLFAPLDTVPLHRLKDAYISQENSAGAKIVLQRLLQLKKDFPPYYSELASLELYDGRLDYCKKYLEVAQKLDPYTILNGTTYFIKARLAQNRHDEAEFNKYLSLAFVFSQSYQQSVLGLALTEDLDGEKFIQTVLTFIQKNADSNDDQLSAVDNFNNNLILMRKTEWSQRLLELVVGGRIKLKQEDLDHYSYLLQETYAANGQSDKLPTLYNKFSQKAVRPLEARLLIAKGKFPEAKSKLQQSLKHYKYEEVANIWDLYFRYTHDWNGLIRMYSVLDSLPSSDTVAEHLSKVAEIYVDQKQFANAAREFHEISLYHYEDPIAHSREARFWWLAGKMEKARQANQRLQCLIPDNPIYRNLYRSNIDAQVWQGVTILRALVPNKLSGFTFRTGVFLHPPLRVTFPQDVHLSTINGELALIGGTWFEKTDGVKFTISDLQAKTLFAYRLDPNNDLSQRTWNSFVWKNSVPQNVVFATNPGHDNSFDWIVLSIRDAR